MRFAWAFPLLAVLPAGVTAFSPLFPHNSMARRAILPKSPSLALSSSSRIEGNQREPSIQELAVMDEMITKLLNAEMYELPNAVKNAFRVIRTPRFFLRIAQLADATKDEGLKTRYNNLAQNLVSTLDALVSTVQDTLDDCAESIETIVKAAAEPDSGEFLVPLTPERIVAMKAAFDEYDDKDSTFNNKSTDEGFLSTIDAWMSKAHLDGMDGMVEILQMVVQIYAARRILQQTTEPSLLMTTLLNEPPTTWQVTIRNHQAKAADDDDSIIREIQRNMESIVLSLETGSMRQKVQAEFLQEMARVAALAVSS